MLLVALARGSVQRSRVATMVDTLRQGCVVHPLNDRSVFDGSGTRACAIGRVRKRPSSPIWICYVYRFHAAGLCRCSPFMTQGSATDLEGTFRRRQTQFKDTPESMIYMLRSATYQINIAAPASTNTNQTYHALLPLLRDVALPHHPCLDPTTTTSRRSSCATTTTVYHPRPTIRRLFDRSRD
jgi:hypothetical protein